MLGSDRPREAGPGAAPRQWAGGWGDRGQGSFSFTRFSSPSHSPAFEMQGCIFFFNYFELLEMIYELLYQAPNSFITCFLKESSKEQSVSVELEPTANTAPRDL